MKPARPIASLDAPPPGVIRWENPPPTAHGGRQSKNAPIIAALKSKPNAWALVRIVPAGAASGAACAIRTLGRKQKLAIELRINRRADGKAEIYARSVTL